MKKQWKEFCLYLRKQWAMVCVFFQVKMDGIRLTMAIYMANALQRAKNKRFYVIENDMGKLIWLCNDDIKAMQKPRKVRKLINGRLRTFKFYMIDPKKTHLDIMRDCLYYTPASWNNKDGMSPAERAEKTGRWLKYMEKVRMDRLFGAYKLK